MSSPAASGVLTGDVAVAHPVLEPVRIGSLTLGNRAVVAPMSRVSAAARGMPTEQMAGYYAGFAAGGFGLIITEGSYTDDAHSQAYAGQPGLVSDEQEHGWRAVTQAVHAAGSPIIAQLMHGGALSQFLQTTVAPSAVQPRGRKLRNYGGDGPFPQPQTMSREQIARVRQGFADAAQRAYGAGFDGVEIHAANGYLLDQFITPYTNLRDDEYGGSSANRIRFAAEVIAAVRASLPPEFVIGVRLSQTKVNDTEHRWRGRSQAAVYFAAVAEAGADYVHVASEGSSWHEVSMLEGDVSVTALARMVTGLTVVANGGMHKPELAAEILRDGHADAVSLGEGALANPDWPQRIQRSAPISEFDHRLLHPSASLDNSERAAAALRAGEL
ncbi:MAG: NADH:flavin oxidoreductase [Actinobacteria bacterium]|nr:NADH:flavin oxidoreductase [Actinomycetota bacterium]